MKKILIIIFILFNLVSFSQTSIRAEKEILTLDKLNTTELNVSGTINSKWLDKYIETKVKLLVQQEVTKQLSKGIHITNIAGDFISISLDTIAHIKTNVPLSIEIPNVESLSEDLTEIDQLVIIPTITFPTNPKNGQIAYLTGEGFWLYEEGKWIKM